ncbi:MAG: Arc family DNA-binding protein [Gammaproteobacteria bacterium]|jgi:plasmid stability protein|nr:MAG: Arc family DNA-binding protein [Gammaproteobacteria bacterium]
MATLTIRNLPEEVRERLRVRAAMRGRSMEAEVRSILTEVTTGDERAESARSLQDWVDELYGDSRPEQVVDGFIAERRNEASAE